MLIILHNPKCSKSRKGLEVLKETGLDFKIIEYLKTPLSIKEIKDLQNKLGIEAIKFTRVKEKEFVQAGLTKDSSNEKLLEAMAKYPKLIERPIVYNNKKAVLGRPDTVKKIKDFLNN